MNELKPCPFCGSKNVKIHIPYFAADCYEGKSKEELEAILKETKRFECKTCGCVFEADNDEYNYLDDYIYSRYYCECPKSAYEVKMR